MISVFVWSFRGKDVAWGHASMQVDQTYISWWPETPGQLRSKIHSDVYTSNPIRNRTFEADIRDEGQFPDHVIQIAGLEDTAIKDWWQSFGLSRDGIKYQGPLLPWSTLTKNCSTVVAMGLKIGGGDKYAPWSKAWNLVWTPADVVLYANSIRQALNVR